MHAMPTTFQEIAEQPEKRIEETKRAYYCSILLQHSGECVPQHTHEWPHDTLVGSGRVRGWCDGKWVGDKGPGEVFETEAGKGHLFMALEPMTHLTCIHYLNGEPYRFLRGTKMGG